MRSNGMNQTRWWWALDGSRKTWREQEEVLSYLGGGHESFSCVVMEVSAYTASWQPAALGPTAGTELPEAARLNA